MFILTYPDSETGEVYIRLVEFIYSKDGDMLCLEVAKFQLDENNTPHKRYKRHKIQNLSVIKPLSEEEIKQMLGPAV
jgi:hypothetical protein